MRTNLNTMQHKNPSALETKLVAEIKTYFELLLSEDRISMDAN